jgi:hypothetical protein
MSGLYLSIFRCAVVYGKQSWQEVRFNVVESDAGVRFFGKGLVGL